MELQLSSGEGFYRERGESTHFIPLLNTFSRAQLPWALASVPEIGFVANSSWISSSSSSFYLSLEEEWIELTQLRLLLVSLIRIKILLSAISWNLLETGIGKKWGRSEKPVKWLMLSWWKFVFYRARPPALLYLVSQQQAFPRQKTKESRRKDAKPFRESIPLSVAKSICCVIIPGGISNRRNRAHSLKADSFAGPHKEAESILQKCTCQSGSSVGRLG